MKKKTISKVLDKKFHDFLLSITDPTVRELVLKNSLISGGCIASLRNNEKVNDYDIYFTNKKTVLAVAYYYANLSETRATVVDVDNLKDHPTEDCLITREWAKEHGMFGAGRVAVYCEANAQGIDSTEDDEVNEALNIMSPTVDAIEMNADTARIEYNKSKYHLQFISPNAISLSHDIQLILRFYGDAKEIHSNYDFVHATNYWLSNNDKCNPELVCNSKADDAVHDKQLLYIGSKYPLASVLRTKKFILRGWKIDAGQYLKMIFQCNALDLTDISVLEDQLVGVDVAYFMALITALKAAQKAHEGDLSFKVTYEYLTPIIDKIFN